MKTLKTRLFEAMLAYLQDRNLTPFIHVDWSALEQLGGELAVQHDDQEATIVLSLSPNAIVDFQILDNMLSFNLSFNHLQTHALIPTASISIIYDANDPAYGLAFDIYNDVFCELQEKELANRESKEPPKRSTPPFLKVVK